MKRLLAIAASTLVLGCDTEEKFLVSCRAETSIEQAEAANFGVCTVGWMQHFIYKTPEACEQAKVEYKNKAPYRVFRCVRY